MHFKGTCDFFGNIKSESYVHFYYADEAMELFSEKIKPYFDDCIIITQDKFLGLHQVEYDFKSINSFDEYQDALEKGYPSMFVLLRETEDIEHVRAAIEMLKESEIESDVLFQMIPDDMYEAHIDNGIYCYFDSMSDYMEDFRNLLEDSNENYGRFDELVFGKKYRCGIICEFFTEILVDGEWIRI